MYGGVYSEFMDYGAIDAFPNPGYGAATGMPTGPTWRPGNHNANVDLLVQKMTDVLQNQLGLKTKNQGHVYTPPFPEWYIGWPYRTGWKLLQISRNFLGKMILALWNI
jgi:hypothetical protein